VKSFPIVRPLSAFLILGCICLLVVAVARGQFDPERRLAADAYVEAVARASCGPMHQDDGCADLLLAFPPFRHSAAALGVGGRSLIAPVAVSNGLCERFGSRGRLLGTHEGSSAFTGRSLARATVSPGTGSLFVCAPRSLPDLRTREWPPQGSVLAFRPGRLRQHSVCRRFWQHRTYCINC
jgi:hypothetical protein